MKLYKNYEKKKIENEIHIWLLFVTKVVTFEGKHLMTVSNDINEVDKIKFVTQNKIEKPKLFSTMLFKSSWYN